MTFIQFIKDRVITLIVNVLCMIALCLFLISIGLQVAELSIVLIFWMIILIVFLGFAYYRTSKRLSRLYDLVVSLDKKYLFSEIVGIPANAEEAIYLQILKMANKSMLEQVSKVSRERKEYKEYIEQWIHEVKTPISAIQLLCENNKSEFARRILCEMGKLNHFIEQALFYARIEQAEKDYLIKEVCVSEIVHTAIAENKQLLIGNGICLEFEESPLTVYTDHKWIEFILNQLIVNAIQYKKEISPILAFSIEQIQNGVALSVKDNGIGINESDLPRIFEKGFTGENGRILKKSTGIGLYLCKRLCEKLGISITVKSTKNEYTIFTLMFPKGTFIKIQD